MVALDGLHALAKDLAAEGFKVATLSETYLTLEGLVRAIEMNPPRFGDPVAVKMDLYQAFLIRGILPLLTKLENGREQYVFGICAHDLQTEDRALRSSADIVVSYQEAVRFCVFPMRYDDPEVSFILIPCELAGEGQDQYLELRDSGAILNRKSRDLFLRGINQDSTAVQSLFAILKYAIAHRASDVHIEPDPNLGEGRTQRVLPVQPADEVNAENEPKNGGRVRYRIDGVLQTAEHVLTPTNIRKLVAVIKNMSELQMDEHRLPQDGRISFSEDDLKRLPHLAEFDLRVSILPTVHGEKAQLRLLRKQAFSYRLDECGFATDVCGRFKRKLREPKGIILVTGPTGSGKTTSLYAALNEINDGLKNIVTVEDPVECLQPGISQVQTDSRIGLDFSRVLRSLMRQDPDVIFVGEIRDEETAKTAVRAAITGHLVLSTLHVDSSLDTVLRLEGLGVPGVYVASSLLAVMSQRLVRRLCPHCVEKYNGRDELKGIWGRDMFDADITLRRAVSGRACFHCGGSGYAERMLLAEFYVPSQTDKALISSGCLDYADYYKAAVSQGFEPMSYVAMRAVMGHHTDLAEVLRSAVTEDEFLRDGPLIAPILKNYLARQRA